jgi:hypothetical protein
MDDKWFKAQQKSAGVTADDIAAKRGKSRVNVSHILTGRQKMSLEWAEAFADVLKVDIATVLEKAGVFDPQRAQQMSPGFADSDVSVFKPAAQNSRLPNAIGTLLGQKPGVDVWTVKGMGMALSGYLPGDFILVDTFQSERVRAGDAVIAQVYGRENVRTVFRRFEPPVLVAASMDPDDARAFVVDGVNVVIAGKVVASWRL